MIAPHASSEGNVVSTGEPPNITQLLKKFSNVILNALLMDYLPWETSNMSLILFPDPKFLTSHILGLIQTSVLS